MLFESVPKMVITSSSASLRPTVILAMDRPGSSSSWTSEDDNSMIESPDSTPAKRCRLSHLTNEEKTMRRKIKNRVAAQAARDRKKAHVDELQILVVKLEEERKLLLRENGDLKKLTLSLSQENKALKDMLHKNEGTAVTAAVASEPVESAELHPQQQEQVPTLHSPVPSALILMTVLSAGFMNCSMKSRQQSKIGRLLHRLLLARPNLVHSRSPPISQIAPLMKWWGSHQRNWNPSKTL